MSSATDKVIIITGGTSGIGLATAQAFATQGSHVYIAGRTADAGEAAAEAAGPSVRFVQTDVTNETDIDELFKQAIGEHGRVDVVIASHGTIGTPGPVSDQPLSDFQFAIDTNIIGSFLVARAAARHLTTGGSLILVASTVGNGVYFPGVAAYAASKAATVALAKTLALELAPVGVRVNALVPGGVDTPMFRSTMGATPESAAHIASLHALERVAHPDELAAAVLFLADDASSFVTGSALTVDGGMSIR